MHLINNSLTHPITRTTQNWLEKMQQNDTKPEEQIMIIEDTEEENEDDSSQISRTPNVKSNFIQANIPKLTKLFNIPRADLH